MHERLYQIQMAHLRRIADALRLLDLAELAACAETIGTDDDCRLIAALRTIVDRLPEDRH